MGNMNLLSIAAMLMAMAAAQIRTSSSQCTLNTMAPYCCEIPGTSSGACTMQSMCNVTPGPAGTCTKDSECTSSSTPCCYKTLGVGSCTTQIFCNAAAGSGTAIGIIIGVYVCIPLCICICCIVGICMFLKAQKKSADMLEVNMG